jgi:excinuclease UvrABC nuclease subunit
MTVEPDNIPDLCGVYALYDKTLKLAYIGSAKSLKKRLKQHTTALCGRIDVQVWEMLEEARWAEYQYIAANRPYGNKVGNSSPKPDTSLVDYFLGG